MKELLKQYKDLQNEIKTLKKRIKQVEKFQMEHDKVVGSNSYFPYQPMTFAIEGYNIQDIDKANELKGILEKRKKKCECLVVEIEKFISDIPYSRTRRIFQYRYINGLEWLPISRRIGGYDESFARKIHDRYLEGLEDK
ncbi:MAG TPA: hypothetical protein VFD17_03690 [Clostridia bacterium]|nr:hypothetical protein [Clostridia bacterium]